MSKEQTIKELREEIKALKQKVAKMEINNALKSQLEDSNKYSYILKNAKIITLEWDFTKDNIVWSKRAEEIMGFEKGAFGSTSEDFLNCLVPGDGNAFSQNLNCKITDGATECQADFRMLKPNGEVLWMSGTSHLTYNEKHEPHILRGVVVDLTKYKKIELEYKDQSDFMRLLLDHIPSHIFWKDKNLIYQGCNKAFISNKGFENVEDIVGLTDKDIKTNVLWADEFRKQDERVLNEKRTLLELEERVKEVDGKEHWYSSTKVPIWKDNEIFGILGLVTDITEKKKDKEYRRVNEERFKAMFYNSPVPLWDEDFTGVYRFFEDIRKQGVSNLDTYFDLYPEKLEWCVSQVKVVDINREVLKLHKESDKSKFLGGLNNTVNREALRFFRYGLVRLFNGETEISGKTIGVDTDGNPLHLLFKISVTKDNEDGRYTGLVANIDITEQSLIQEALADSEERFRTIFEVAKVGIALIDTNRVFHSANEALLEMLGYDKEEFLQKSFLDVTYEEDRSRSKAMVETSIYTKKPFTIEKRYVKKNGDICWSLTSCSPIFTPKGEIKSFAIVVQDTTESKASEIALVKSSEENEKLVFKYKEQNEELIKAIQKAEHSERLKSEFLQNLSHEIRTPMNAILGFTDFLELEGTSASKRKHYINIIKNSGTQLLRIIDDILEISALETKHVSIIEEKFNLNMMFSELFSLYQYQAVNKGLNLYVNKELSEIKSFVISDESKLRKIMMNLVENAIRYTNEGSVEFGYKALGRDIEFFVKDTGVGISEDRTGGIFERFSQAQTEISKKNGGLGLGLSIVKENVKLLNGTVKLESEEGVGSIFRVLIPNSLVIDKIECVGRELSVLIVEDEEINYLYLSTVLEDINPNFKIEHARDGVDAVEFCTKKKYDLILMDIRMGRMNGYEATSRIREMYPNTPIIAQTAYSTESDRRKVIEAGCDDFISKPISIDAIRRVVEQYVDYKE